MRRFLLDSSRRLVETSFLANAAEVVALDADAYRQLLQAAARQNIAGGRIYDAVIYACGVAARVDVLLTFNGRHFRPLANGGIEIVVPT